MIDRDQFIAIENTLQTLLDIATGRLPTLRGDLPYEEAWKETGEWMRVKPWEAAGEWMRTLGHEHLNIGYHLQRRLGFNATEYRPEGSFWGEARQRLLDALGVLELATAESSCSLARSLVAMPCIVSKEMGEKVASDRLDALRMALSSSTRFLRVPKFELEGLAVRTARERSKAAEKLQAAIDLHLLEVQSRIVGFREVPQGWEPETDENGGLKFPERPVFDEESLLEWLNDCKESIQLAGSFPNSKMHGKRLELGRMALRNAQRALEVWVVESPPIDVFVDDPFRAERELVSLTKYLSGKRRQTDNLVVKSEHNSDPKEAKHSDDFASVDWFGTLYEFTGNQAKCVKVLWTAWENGTPVLSRERIIDIAGIERADGKLDQVFRVGRSVHPAWGTMIVSTKKNSGRYCLRTPDAPQ
jgi:hypothetical protein